MPTAVRKFLGFGFLWVPILYYAPPPLMVASWLVTIFNDWSIRQCLKEDEDRSAIGDMIAGKARVTIYVSVAMLIPTFIVGIMIVTTKDSYFAIAGGAGMIAAFADQVRLIFLPKEKMESFIRKMLTAQNKLN